MDFGISKSAVTGYPNNFKINQVIVKIQIQTINITYGRHNYVSGERRAKIWRTESGEEVKIKNLSD